MMQFNGPFSGGGPGDVVIPVMLPAPAGWLKVRYVTSRGKYLGEMEFFAIDKEAAAIILSDVRDKLGSILVMKPGA
jgi:hypothetical protein